MVKKHKPRLPEQHKGSKRAVLCRFRGERVISGGLREKPFFLKMLGQEKVAEPFNRRVGGRPERALKPGGLPLRRVEEHYFIQEVCVVFASFGPEPFNGARRLSRDGLSAVSLYAKSGPEDLGRAVLVKALTEQVDYFFPVYPPPRIIEGHHFRGVLLHERRPHVRGHLFFLSVPGRKIYVEYDPVRAGLYGLLHARTGGHGDLEGGVGPFMVFLLPEALYLYRLRPRKLL